MRYAIWPDMSATWKALESALPATRTTLANTTAAFEPNAVATGIKRNRYCLLAGGAFKTVRPLNNFYVNYSFGRNQIAGSHFDDDMIKKNYSRFETTLATGLLLTYDAEKGVAKSLNNL